MEMTIEDLEKFNIDAFVNHCEKLDDVDVFLLCQNLGLVISGMDRYSCNSENTAEFSGFMLHIQLIMAQHRELRKPMGMTTANYLKATPIIKKLVLCKNLHAGMINAYHHADN
jgi:hypothetical protein